MIFTLFRRFVAEVKVASVKEPFWHLTSDKGYRHAFLFSVGTITHQELKGCQLMFGPLMLTIGVARVGAR